VAKSTKFDTDYIIELPEVAGHGFQRVAFGATVKEYPAGAEPRINASSLRSDFFATDYTDEHR